MQQQEKYFDFVFQIIGESIVPNPEKLFETPNVYLLIDQPLNIIWIWAGSKSRLFHRYIAANWAGKLKGKKEFLNFKYEVIKEGREPVFFQSIMEEIKSGGSFQYPGESRETEAVVQVSAPMSQSAATQQSPIIATEIVIPKTGVSKNDRAKITALFNEIKEIHSHVKYSIEHIESRFEQIDEIIKRL